MLSLFFLNAAALKSNTSSQSLDSIVAIVNDGVITQSELNKAIDTIKKQYSHNQGSLPPADALRKQVLDQTINRKLQLELAERGGINPSDKDVEKAIQGIAKQNNMSAKQLFEKVREDGMSTAEYRKEIREEMIMQQIQQQQVASRIKVSPQEVDDFMRSAAWKASSGKEYHLEDILIALPEIPTQENIAEAKQQAETVLAKLHQGMSFQQVAMSESSNTQALQGGDLGWRKLPEIPEVFSSELVHMKVNGIMGPILTPNGFHIVKLAGIRESKKGAKDDERKQIQQLLFQRKFEEALQSWIMKLRSESYINLKPQ